MSHTQQAREILEVTFLCDDGGPVVFFTDENGGERAVEVPVHAKGVRLCGGEIQIHYESESGAEIRPWVLNVDGKFVSQR